MVTGYIVRLNAFGVDVQNPATLLRLRLAAFIHADSHVFWYCYHIQTHLNLSSVLRHNLPSRVGVGYVLEYDTSP
jgi:hypothetical protein